MRIPSRIAFAMVAVCLGGIFWGLLRHSEPGPSYLGKPLSYWLSQYTISHRNLTGAQQIVDANAPIDAAVRHMGTNATPTLLRMLRAKDSVLTIKLMALVRKQKVVKFDYFPASLQNSQAAWAFAALDGMDKTAVPKLVRIYEEHISAASQSYAIRALGTFNGQNELRVPIFIKALQNPDMGGRIYALTALAGIDAEDAKPAVPAIVGALQDTNGAVRSAASAVLRQIDAAAAVKAGVK